VKKPKLWPRSRGSSGNIKQMGRVLAVFRSKERTRDRFSHARIAARQGAGAREKKDRKKRQKGKYTMEHSKNKIKKRVILTGFKLGSHKNS